MQFTIIFSLLVAILAVAFSMQNPVAVTLHILNFEFRQPLAIFLLIAFALGALSISVLTIPGWLKSKNFRYRHNKQVVALEDSVRKYQEDLLSAQDNIKDLRKTVFEVEESKEQMERAHTVTETEINDLRIALNDAKLTIEQAKQARQEAVDARSQIDLAIAGMDEHISSYEDSSLQISASLPSETDEKEQTPNDEKTENKRFSLFG